MDGDTYQGGGVIGGKSGSSWRGGVRDTEPEQDVYGGVAGPNRVMNVGGGDGGTRLTVAEGAALREICARETTKECRDNDGEGGELPHDTVVRRSVTAG